jgi:hypothetical protein
MIKQELKWYGIPKQGLLTLSHLFKLILTISAALILLSEYSV